MHPSCVRTNPEPDREPTTGIVRRDAADVARWTSINPWTCLQADPLNLVSDNIDEERNRLAENGYENSRCYLYFPFSRIQKL